MGPAGWKCIKKALVCLHVCVCICWVCRHGWCLSWLVGMRRSSVRPWGAERDRRRLCCSCRPTAKKVQRAIKTRNRAKPATNRGGEGKAFRLSWAEAGRRRKKGSRRRRRPAFDRPTDRPTFVTGEKEACFEQLLRRWRRWWWWWWRTRHFGRRAFTSSFDFHLFFIYTHTHSYNWRSNWINWGIPFNELQGKRWRHSSSTFLGRSLGWLQFLS